MTTSCKGKSKVVLILIALVTETCEILQHYEITYFDSV